MALFKWVMAVREYFYVTRKIEPARNSYILSEKQKNDAEERYKAKEAEMAALEIELTTQKEKVS